MRLLVSDIKAARFLEKMEAVDPGPLFGDPPEFVSFRHPVQANLTQADIIVSGHVSALITFNCSRCLEDFDRTIEGDFQEVYGLSEEFIDVTNDIRETIFIDLPLRAVCKEECKGICPRCGVNKNFSTCDCPSAKAESRWDALKKYRFH